MHRKAYPQHSATETRTVHFSSRVASTHNTHIAHGAYRVPTRKYYCEAFDSHRARLTSYQLVSLERIRKIEGEIDKINPWKITYGMSVPACLFARYLNFVDSNIIVSITVEKFVDLQAMRYRRSETNVRIVFISTCLYPRVYIHVFIFKCIATPSHSTTLHHTPPHSTTLHPKSKKLCVLIYTFHLHSVEAQYFRSVTNHVS